MARPSFLVPGILGMLASLGGCAADTGSYPSLAPRAVEKLSFAEPVRETAAPAADPALMKTVADQRGSLAGIVKRFDAAAAAADRASQASGAKAAGSDAWLAAQTAIGGLDTVRGDLSTLIDVIDAAIADRVAGGAPVDPALGSVRDDAAAEAAREDAAIARLDARLPKG